MDGQVLLTVGIPTYNGEKFLRETVVSVIDRCKEVNRDDIEILISDNGSTDATAVIAAACLEEFAPYVVVIRNEVNLGFDQNIDLLFQRAHGKYIEILGDDDYLEKDHFKYLLPHLEDVRSVGAVLLGVSFLDVSTGKRQSINLGKENYRGLTGNEFFLLSGWRSAAVSAVVVEKSRWKQFDFKQYYGSQWIHVAGLIHVLANDANASILAKSTVVVRVNNNRWQRNGNQLLLGLRHLLLLSEMTTLGYHTSVYQHFLEERYRTNLRDTLSMRPRDNEKRAKAFRLMVRLFWRKPGFWIIQAPIMLLLTFYDLLLKLRRK